MVNASKTFSEWLNLKIESSRADFVRSMASAGVPISSAAAYQWCHGISFPKKESIEAVSEVFQLNGEDSRKLKIALALEKAGVPGVEYPT